MVACGLSVNQSLQEVPPGTPHHHTSEDVKQPIVLGVDGVLTDTPDYIHERRLADIGKRELLIERHQLMLVPEDPSLFGILVRLVSKQTVDAVHLASDSRLIPLVHLVGVSHDLCLATTCVSPHG
jgi:hypothetical protein